MSDPTRPSYPSYCTPHCTQLLVMVSHPHSRFDLVFNSALDAYTKRTRQYLPSHPLLSRLQSCDSAEAVLAVLREQIPTFRYSDDTFSMWLIPTVNVLHAFSANLGEGVGLVSSISTPCELYRYASLRCSLRRNLFLRALAFSFRSASTAVLLRRLIDIRIF
jgi:hypothetical protein